MTDDDITEVLTEDVDEEILSRMPEWFQLLRRVYKKKHAHQTLF